MAEKARAARRMPAKTPLWHRLSGWLRNHVEVAVTSLLKIFAAPLGSLLTALVIGIAFALPALLYVAVVNLEGLGIDWQGTARISMFLTHEQSNDKALELAEQLNGNPDIASIEMLTREQALEEFRSLAVAPDLLDVLHENPLPPLLIVEPKHADQPAEVDRLATELRGLPQAEFVVVDMRWVERLLAIMQTARRLVGVMSLILGVGVIVVVGNTIRLLIQNRAAEINVVRLVGGTDSFIRRPFLYTGFWYGSLGGVIGLIILLMTLALIDGPVSRLAGLYDSGYQLSGLGADGALIMLGCGGLLGLFGAWLAVARHLRSQETV